MVHRDHFPPVVYICVQCQDKIACKGCNDEERKEHIKCLRCSGLRDDTKGLEYVHIEDLLK